MQSGTANRFSHDPRLLALRLAGCSPKPQAAAVPHQSPIMKREAAEVRRCAMINPDFKDFARLARSATLVPVVKSVSADLLTPVSAFLAIAEKEPHAFLLESVERGEQIGRYTFLGARPYMRLRARGSAIEIERGRQRERRQGNVFHVVKELLSEHRPA